MRAQTILFDSDIVRVRAVHCCAPAGGCAPIEWAEMHSVVFAESGVFLKHLSRNAAVVADRGHAVFFTANRPYRVSHPVPGGDDCLVLDLAPTALADALQALDPDSAERPDAPFRRTAVPLPPRVVARRRLLHHRIVGGVASALEVEEGAVALLRASVRASAEHVRESHRRETARRAGVAEAAQLIIASQATTRWTLRTLAQAIGCSPFHLAHVFRATVGISLHQYQLRVRLGAALDEVMDSERGLSAIALDAGFTHHSHFSAAFHRAFGITPSALRRDAMSRDVTRLRKILTASSVAHG
ncbi:MAG TPA: helix-turn-helix transcriptional regulator [Gemmatimonadaceae bacterium]